MPLAVIASRLPASSRGPPLKAASHRIAIGAPCSRRLSRLPARRALGIICRASGPLPEDEMGRNAHILQTLKEFWGYDAYRPYQDIAVDAISAGRDVVVVLATGSGKSVCYQLPPVHESKVVMVISPLISLMQDQVRGRPCFAPSSHSPHVCGCRLPIDCFPVFRGQRFMCVPIS